MASQMFAKFIWEACEKEVSRARKADTVVGSIKRLQLVLQDAKRGSSIYQVITPEVVSALADKLRSETPDCWNDAVEAAMDEILGHLRQEVEEAAMESPDAASPPDAMLTLLQGATRKCRDSPVQRLRDHPFVFRVVLEYLTKVPFKKRWQIGRRLGEGGHATVRRCTHSYRYPGKCMALKQITQGRASEFEIEMLRREARIMRTLFHPHVPVVFDYTEEQRNCFLVMPLYEGGDMLERIVERSGNHFTEETCKVLLRDLLDTIAYLHNSGVAHRDIKPENVVFENRSETAAMFLIDFGFAATGVHGASLTTPCGTPQYAAPEILNAMPHGTKVDMWSLGVVTYVMLSGFPPFYHDDEAELFRLIKRGEFEFPSPSWDPISDKAKDFIRRLLNVDQEQRYSADQALRHPWLVEASDNVHLGLVHSEAIKFRARSQWTMAVQAQCETAHESFTLKNLRLQQANAEADREEEAVNGKVAEETIPEAASAEPASEEPAAPVEMNEEESERMRQTMASAVDAGIENVVRTYSTFIEAHAGAAASVAPPQPATPPAPPDTVSEKLRAEVVRLKAIVNKQRCEISNLQIQLDEMTTKVLEYEKAEIARHAPVAPPPIGAPGGSESSRRVAFQQSQPSEEEPPEVMNGGGGGRRGEGEANGDVSGATDGEGPPDKPPLSPASDTPKEGSITRMKSWGSSLIKRGGWGSTFKKATADGPPGRKTSRRSSLERLQLNSSDAQFYTMEDLTSGSVEANIDPTRRELYLSNEEFEDNFKMTKEQFLAEPKWRQVNKKKQLRLF